MNVCNVDVRGNDAISFEDLLTKEELREILRFADDNLALWILVIISLGSTRAEAKFMTNEMFFKGTGRGWGLFTPETTHASEIECNSFKSGLN